MAGRSRGATDSCVWGLGVEVLGLGRGLFVLGFWAMAFCHWRFVPSSYLYPAVICCVFHSQAQMKKVGDNLGPHGLMIKVVQRFPQYILQLKVLSFLYSITSNTLPRQELYP